MMAKDFALVPLDEEVDQQSVRVLCKVVSFLNQFFENYEKTGDH